MKVAELSLHLESDDLFVRFHVPGLQSAKDAEAIIAAGPKLVIIGGWLYLDCVGRNLMAHGDGENTSDKCGRWPEGAERWTAETITDNSCGVPEFLSHPIPADFHLVWFSVCEWEISQNGIRLVSSKSEKIGIPVLG